MHFCGVENDRKIVFDFGEVVLKKNPRARTIRIRVHPEKGVQVVAPASCRDELAINFVIEKEVWIRKSLARMAHTKQKLTVFTVDCHFKTFAHELVLQQHAKSTLKMELKGGKLIVYYPENVSYLHERVQEFTRKAILQTLRIEAKKYLPLRTRELAESHGYNVNEVSVRNNKTRWGSCSGKNNISLNIHLMRLPERLIDYVIMHELVHTKVKNHSKYYWDALEKVLPGARKLDKQLNNYHLTYW